MNTGNMTMVYGAVAVLSVLLLIGYLLIEKKKERNFIFLISCVAIVNTGYFWCIHYPAKGYRFVHGN